MPIDQSLADRPVAPLVLIASYWAVILLSSAFIGLLFATRSALYMDICTPAVAATQFTAYMAMVNLTDRVFVRLAGLVRRQAGLSVDPGHRRPARHGQPAAVVVDGPPAHNPICRCG